VPVLLSGLNIWTHPRTNLRLCKSTKVPNYVAKREIHEEVSDRLPIILTKSTPSGANRITPLKYIPCRNLPVHNTPH